VGSHESLYDKTAWLKGIDNDIPLVHSKRFHSSRDCVTQEYGSNGKQGAWWSSERSQLIASMLKEQFEIIESKR